MCTGVLRGIGSAVLLLAAAACGGGGGGGGGSEGDSKIDPGAGFNQGQGFNGVVLNVTPATDGSGDVYVAGNFDGYNGAVVNFLVRLNADGSLDSGFDTSNGFNGFVNAVAPAADGSGDVYAGGSFNTYGLDVASFIARLNADGTLDTDFDGGCNNDVQAIEPAADGSGDVYAGGQFGDCFGLVNRLVRLNADGAVDTGFDIGTGFDDIVVAVRRATDGSGDLYVGGFFTSYDGVPASHIVRLNADGTRDAGFDIGIGLNDDAFALAPAADGSGDVYVGGGFTAYMGMNARGLARLNEDGTLDAGFNIGSGFDQPVLAIAPAGDGSGDVYVGGAFTSYNGMAANHIVRLNANGSVDPGFATGAGFNDTVRSIALAADGSGDVFAGGQFTSYGGTAVGRVARLDTDGTLD